MISRFYARFENSHATATGCRAVHKPGLISFLHKKSATKKDPSMKEIHEQLEAKRAAEAAGED